MIETGKLKKSYGSIVELIPLNPPAWQHGGSVIEEVVMRAWQSLPKDAKFVSIRIEAEMVCIDYYEEAANGDLP